MAEEVGPELSTLVAKASRRVALTVSTYPEAEEEKSSRDCKFED